MKIKKLLAASILLAVTTLALVSPVRAAAKETVTVATDSDTAPFTYKKDKQFDGYDIALVKAIFKGSKQYKAKFETVAFSSILTGIDAGRYQMSANNFNYSDERAEKYLFSDPVSKSNYAIASKKGKFNTLDSMSGKSVEVYAGSNYAAILENWNKRHSDETAIDIHYVANSVTLTQRLQNVEAGKIDFLLYDAISLKTVIKDQGMKLKVANVQGKVGGAKDGLEYLLFAKDKTGQKLQKFVNRRIKVLQKDGTLKKLSQKYFGGDYVSSLD
ncbi:transporter substrate-binding domain-containing protein [Streptococcus caviae]|uniref:transporter substrate-binding domain-containing protein n=1 Tax=Streptococcus sp. 'caviae' TaxID=1915004 RepID=UPI00094B88F1|nr:transporter substrate-binding domain-containing protein [Streptococcus sp. 'caviae']OLN84535.1 amino acid ABC transporter substrate-binding protein [Streptococcus sp. 'caviae']